MALLRGYFVIPSAGASLACLPLDNSTGLHRAHVTQQTSRGEGELVLLHKKSDTQANFEEKRLGSSALAAHIRLQFLCV